MRLRLISHILISIVLLFILFSNKVDTSFARCECSCECESTGNSCSTYRCDGNWEKKWGWVCSNEDSESCEWGQLNEYGCACNGGSGGGGGHTHTAKIDYTAPIFIPYGSSVQFTKDSKSRILPFPKDNSQSNIVWAGSSNLNCSSGMLKVDGLSALYITRYGGNGMGGGPNISKYILPFTCSNKDDPPVILKNTGGVIHFNDDKGGIDTNHGERTYMFGLNLPDNSQYRRYGIIFPNEEVDRHTKIDIARKYQSKCREEHKDSGKRDGCRESPWKSGCDGLHLYHDPGPVGNWKLVTACGNTTAYWRNADGNKAPAGLSCVSDGNNCSTSRWVLTRSQDIKNFRGEVNNESQSINYKSDNHTNLKELTSIFNDFPVQNGDHGEFLYAKLSQNFNIEVEQDGRYAFAVNSAHWQGISIDGQTVVNGDGGFISEKYLTKGKHSFYYWCQIDRNLHSQDCGYNWGVKVNNGGRKTYVQGITNKTKKIYIDTHQVGDAVNFSNNIAMDSVSDSEITFNGHGGPDINNYSGSAPVKLSLISSIDYLINSIRSSNPRYSFTGKFFQLKNLIYNQDFESSSSINNWWLGHVEGTAVISNNSYSGNRSISFSHNKRLVSGKNYAPYVSSNIFNSRMDSIKNKKFTLTYWAKLSGDNYDNQEKTVPPFGVQQVPKNEDWSRCQSNSQECEFIDFSNDVTYSKNWKLYTLSGFFTKDPSTTDLRIIFRAPLPTVEGESGPTLNIDDIHFAFSDFKIYEGNNFNINVNEDSYVQMQFKKSSGAICQFDKNLYESAIGPDNKASITVAPNISGGEVSGFQWDVLDRVSDEVISSNITPTNGYQDLTYAFSDSGKYSVKLTIVDKEGNSNSCFADVDIKPFCSIIIEPKLGRPDDTYNITSGNSDNSLNYSWYVQSLDKDAEYYKTTNERNMSIADLPKVPVGKDKYNLSVDLTVADKNDLNNSCHDNFTVSNCPKPPLISTPKATYIDLDSQNSIKLLWSGYDASDPDLIYSIRYKIEGDNWKPLNSSLCTIQNSNVTCSLDISDFNLLSNQKVYFKVSENKCNQSDQSYAIITTRPWYQIESGDSYAGMESNISPYNTIYDKIPAQHYACLNSSDCIPYFNAKNNGFISVNDSENSLSLGDEASIGNFCENNDPSCLAISNNEYQDKNYDYAYWIRMVDNKTTSVSDWNSVLNPSEETYVVEPVLTNPISPEPTFSLPSIFDFFIKLFSPIRSFFSGNTISSVVREKQTDVLGVSSENGGIFVYTGDKIPKSDFSGKQVMVIADGDINITGDIVINENSGGAFVLITSGNINISSNVTRLDGYYIADKKISTSYDSSGIDQQLTVSGGLISWDQTEGVNLQRNLDSQDNAKKPAELFVQRPDIIKALYDSDILRPAFNGSYTWQEVSP